MNVDNGSLQRYGIQACIVAIECDDNTWMYRAVLENGDEYGSPDLNAEFASVPEAVEWLHEKALEALTKECEHKAWIGRQAQKTIDDISEYGFNL